MMRISDRLIAAPRSTLDQAKTYAARFTFPNGDADVLAYLTEVYSLAPKVGLDPSIVVAQSVHETDSWQSPAWRERLNPAGIGITDGPDFGYRWENGTDAARAQIVHLFYYANADGQSAVDHRMALMILDRYLHLDPRLAAIDDAGWLETVRTIADLTGKWATDPKYAEKIVARGNAIYPALPDQTGGDMARPIIVVDAGHRSTDRSGNPAEMTLTDDMAAAVVAELRRRGYQAHWWQRDLDRDADPDETVGSLDTVALGIGRWIEGVVAQGQTVVFLSEHYNGSHSPVHVIVADNRGLRTAYSGGAPADDTAAVNQGDVRLARMIAANYARDGLGSLFTGKLGIPGVMSETETGVGLDGFRLAVFAATVRGRENAYRLVVENGGTDDPAALRDDFTERAARAQADALDAVFAGGTPTTTTTPAPEPTITYPAGMDEGIASRLFGLVKGEDGKNYSFSPTGGISREWLRIGAGRNAFPGLTEVWVYEDGRRYFVFGSGVLVLWQANETAPVKVLG